MAIEVKVPSLPESVADAIVVNWHKKAGDAVKRDEALVEVETDKVVLEVPSPTDGVLEEIIEQEGATVVAEQLLARINSTASAPATGGKKETPQDAPKESTQETQQTESIITPSANKLIVENKLDASQITGSGRDGRVLKEDVLQYLSDQKSKPAEKPVEAKTVEAKPAEKSPVIEPVSGERSERRVPMTRLRARIAERLVEAQQTAAILTTFNEVDMQPVMDLRKKYQDKFEKEYGIKLGFMSFFVKACVNALKEIPAVNAEIDGDDIVYKNYYDLGVAVSTPQGLVVPVVRDCDEKSMAQIEKDINDVGARAREGKIQLEEMSGGTFTITNGGVFGSLLSTPILNTPQSAILGMHKIDMRPMVMPDGSIQARPMMYLALSYDHRIIDGREAVTFLVRVKDAIEDPQRLLLDI